MLAVSRFLEGLGNVSLIRGVGGISATAIRRRRQEGRRKNDNSHRRTDNLRAVTGLSATDDDLGLGGLRMRRRAGMLVGDRHSGTEISLCNRTGQAYRHRGLNWDHRPGIVPAAAILAGPMSRESVFFWRSITL